MINTKFPIYGSIILLAILTNVIIVLIIYKKYNISRDEIIGALVYENFGFIYGAKLLTYIEHYSTIKKFEFFKLGLSSYGAAIGGIICLLIFALQYKIKLKDICTIFCPSLPLMYAIGKVACFLVGCCYGVKYNGIGSIVYKYSKVAPNNVHLFPIQIVETIIFTLIFIYIIRKVLKNKFEWKIIGFSLILCSISKFLLEFLRTKETTTFLSFTQKISIIFVLIGLFIYIKSLIRLKK